MRWPSSTRLRISAALSCASAVVQAGEDHRQHDVLQRGHHRDQVERLKDVADLAAAHPRQLVAVELGDIDFVDVDLALGGLVEPADHVEQRALARARLGPMIEMYSPRLMEMVTPLSAWTSRVAHLVGALDVDGADGVFGESTLAASFDHESFRQVSTLHRLDRLHPRRLPRGIDGAGDGQADADRQADSRGDAGRSPSDRFLPRDRRRSVSRERQRG